MISTDEFPPEVKSYDEVALEYYDPAAHPTCKNFRDGSLRFLTSHLTDRELIGTALDVGAGSSILGEVLTLRGLPLGKLVLIDRYARMLKHSRIYSVAGAMLVMGDAEALPIKTGSTDLIVASLGDPFNVSAFWAEVAHCLRGESAYSRHHRTNGRNLFAIRRATKKSLLLISSLETGPSYMSHRSSIRSASNSNFVRITT